VFKDFDYKSKFEFGQEEGEGEEGKNRNKAGDNVTITETMKDRRGKVRKNVRSLRMSGQKIIIGEAKDSGFTMLGQYDLVKSQREYQYIYILYKPSN
jgi:hypothetical protein